jgi:hypothetical protein
MLSTKDVKGGEGTGLQKTLKPGNVKVKINKVELEAYTFKPGAYHVISHVETEPVGGDFVGFAIDKNNPSLGNHLGQIGKVKAGQYAFADTVLNGGKEIKRDMEIMRHIKFLCLATGCADWFDAQDDKHPTIESFIAAFNTDRPFADKYIHTCLAGKKYKNDKGFDAYDLHYAKYHDGKSGFGSDASKVLVFDEKIHIVEKTAPAAVEGFDGNNNGGLEAGGALGAPNSDFTV